MMKGGMGNMLKQAQMMQANMQKVQDQLAATEVEMCIRDSITTVWKPSTSHSTTMTA